jgi:hypothetical protein
MPSSATTVAPLISIERGEALLVGADHRLRIVAFADLREHALTGLDRTHAPRFGALDQRADLFALQRGWREHEDFRPHAQIGRLDGKTCAFGQEQASLGASLLQMQALQRLDLWVGSAGDVVGHVRPRSPGGFALWGFPVFA